MFLHPELARFSKQKLNNIKLDLCPQVTEKIYQGLKNWAFIPSAAKSTLNNHQGSHPSLQDSPCGWWCDEWRKRKLWKMKGRLFFSPWSMSAWKGKGKLMLCTGQTQICSCRDTLAWPTLTPLQTECLDTDRRIEVHFHSWTHILSVMDIL